MDDEAWGEIDTAHPGYLGSQDTFYVGTLKGVGRVYQQITSCSWAINDIDHTKTKVKSPQTNGICERFHKTILQEFYQVTFRKKIYETIEQLQNDLDEWIDHYNVNGGGIMLHARRPGGPVAAAQNCATHGPLSVATRGRRCTAWSSMRRFDWRLSTRV